MLAADVADKKVRQVWRSHPEQSLSWQRGAIDAYSGRRPQLIGTDYLFGYAAQLQVLPVDEEGQVEWFRLRSEGSWKLTDNL